MSEPAPTYDTGKRLPDLTPQEVRAVTQWARRVKAGEERRMFQDERGRLSSVPVETGDVDRA